MDNNDIEVELRGLLSKDKYDSLLSYFKSNNYNVTPDNKITYFFVTKGFILKVTDEEQNNNAKITVKQGDETRNVLKEYEIKIDRKDIDKSIKLFQELGYKQFNKVKQIRYNIGYEDSFIALKYSDDWGYHFEIEKMVSSRKESLIAKNALRVLCKSLDLVYLTPSQIKRKIQEINNHYGF